MPRKSRSKRVDIYHHDIPTKANRILNIVLIAIVLILVRIWHLSVVQYDQKLEEARKPQKKSIIEPAIRATIRDRFNLPLAVNKIHYQATILYSQLRDIPSIIWQKEESTGKKVKKFKRKEYIHQLAELLAKELNLESDRIEDLIHSKASYYAQMPYVIKEELTEKEYYRLRMLSKEWPGIYVRKLPRRHYPRGRVAADIIGYMGAINKQQYESILLEIKVLEQLISQGDEAEDFPPGIENTEQARRRLKDLEEKAYTIHDYVGTTGIERMYEEELRGFYGKKKYYSDSKGNFLRELPGSRPPISGHRILLTISAELQEYAEQILAQNEPLRLVRLSHLGEAKKTILALKHPWIKGGSIVAMDPQNGEILTLASYPRFDPNDFIASGNVEINKEKKARINRWFESETYLANLWNQQQPLERERYDSHTNQFYDEKSYINWQNYLEYILPINSPLKKAVEKVATIKNACIIQQSVENLQALCEGKNVYAIFNAMYNSEPHIAFDHVLPDKHLDGLLQTQRTWANEIKRDLQPHFNSIPQNYDKVLLVDLCRLAVEADRFSPELLAQVGSYSISSYKEATDSYVTLMGLLREKAQVLYCNIDFKKWRQREEKEYLKQKRSEEKQTKSYPKPYLDYLDRMELKLFKGFWEHYKENLLHAFLTGKINIYEDVDPNLTEGLEPYLVYFSNWYQDIQEGSDQKRPWKEAYTGLQKSIQSLTPDLALQFFKTMRSYLDLNRPLLGTYRSLRQNKAPLEKHLAAAFYPIYGFGYGRSYAFRQAATQGSIFKLVTAYEALIQSFRKLERPPLTFNELNPLVIVDQVHTQGQTTYVGYTKDGKSIPQLYKGGRVPRSLAHKNTGEVDLVRALEMSSNPYFSLLAGECLENPEDLAEAARLFSFGNRTGIDLPGEISGKVPKDLDRNRTGLYAMAIGQHSLVVTPLQTAVMLSAFANGGKILKPKIVNLTAGRQPNREDQLISYPSLFSYQQSLACAGIDFPLFTAVSLQNQKNLVERIPVEVKRNIPMPQLIRYTILRGLQAAALRTHQESTQNLARLYQNYPEAIGQFTELKHQIIGKTSTSESVESIDLDLKEGTNIYTHVWFGSIVFSENSTRKNAKTFIFKDEFGQPELVIVVYLRYGGYGKEAAPLAAQMVKKWRELKQKYAQTP